MRKSNQLSVRLDPELIAEIEECCEAMQTSPHQLISTCLKEYVQQVKTNGAILMPITIVSKAELKKSMPGVGIAAGRRKSYSTLTTSESETNRLNETPPSNPGRHGAPGGISSK